jgi:heat shock protein HslJ
MQMRRLDQILFLAVMVLATACAPLSTPTNAPPLATPTPTLPPYGVPGESLIGTEWRLVSYGPPDGPQQPVAESTLTFRSATEFGGTAGCNHYFGAYTLAGETLTIRDLGATERACLDEGVMEQESAFLAALNAARLLTVIEDTLTITYETGVLKFERVWPPPPAALEGTLWRLEAFEAGEVMSSLIAGTEITARFAEDKISGYSGCNWYSAEYTVEGATLKFGVAQQTVRDCLLTGAIEQETQFAEALQATTEFSIEGDRLTLSRSSGKLHFRAMPALSGPPFTGAAWRLVTFDAADPAQRLPENLEITATFDVEKVAGSAGCNTYTGSYTVEGDRVQVAGMGLTKKACEPETMQAEQRFVFEMQKPNLVVVETGRLTLINDNGLMVFETNP